MSVCNADPLLNAWTGVHFFGSFTGVHVLHHYGMTLENSWMTMLIAGIVWELCDRFIGKWIFDERGIFEPEDIGANFLGCTLRFYLK